MSERTTRDQATEREYLAMLANRGEVTPDDPLRFHLHHLVRYWYRIVEFSRQRPHSVFHLIQSDLGSCIRVATGQASPLVSRGEPIYNPWQDYLVSAAPVLEVRYAAFEEIEAACLAFNRCPPTLGFNPWVNAPIESEQGQQGVVRDPPPASSSAGPPDE